MFLLLVLSILLGLSQAGSTGKEFPSNDQREVFGKMLKKFESENHVPCLTAGYFQEYDNEDRELFSESVGGQSDVDIHTQCSANTMMRIGGLSEAIESLLTAKYVQNGTLNLDEDIHKYLPQSVFPIKYWYGKEVKITLRQLLSHQSGIRDLKFDDLLHYWENPILNTSQTIAVFANDPLESEPGTKVSYTRHGVNLIAAIIEHVDNRVYKDILNDFLQEMMLWLSGVEDNQLVLRRATQYRPGKDSQGNFQYWQAPIGDNLRPYPHWAAEGILSYSGDITSISQMVTETLMGRNKYLKKETLEEFVKTTTNAQKISLHINGKVVSDIETSYVLGWQRMDFPTVVPQLPQLSNMTVIYNTARFESGSGIIAIMPQKHFALTFISNLGGQDLKLQELVFESFIELFNAEMNE